MGSCEYDVEGNITLTIEADDYEDLPPSLKRGLLALKLESSRYVPGKPATDRLPDYALLSGYNMELYNGLSPEDKELLSYRCLHHFLRNYGNKVASVLFDEFYRLTLLTSSFWTTRQEYELALDITMVGADVAIRQNQSNTYIGHCIHGVGQHLEANGKHEDAAKLYMQMTTVYFKHSDELVRARGYTHAGLAYMYGGTLIWLNNAT